MFDNKFITVFLFVSGSSSESSLTPRGFRRFHTDTGTTFTTTVWVRARILSDTTDRRAETHVAGTTGFTDDFLFVVFVGQRTNSGFTFTFENTSFAGSKFDRDQITFAGLDSSGVAGTSDDLSSFTGSDF